MTNYEFKRLRNIERNLEKLSQMDLSASFTKVRKLLCCLGHALVTLHLCVCSLRTRTRSRRPSELGVRRATLRVARRGCSHSTDQETSLRARSCPLALHAYRLARDKVMLSCVNHVPLSWAPSNACACRYRGGRRSTSTLCCRSSARKRTSWAG